MVGGHVVRAVLLGAVGLCLTTAAIAAPDIREEFRGQVDLGQVGTGFFRLYEAPDGHWWFLDPQGKGFVSLGWNHLVPDLWLRDHNQDHTLTKYGSDFLNEDDEIDWSSRGAERWSRTMFTLMGIYKANSIGYHHRFPSRLLHGVPYVVRFCTDDISTNFATQTWMDPFAQEWHDAIDVQAAAEIAPIAADANVLGIAYCDSPAITVLAIEGEPVVHDWVDHVVRLPTEAAGKQAWVAYMQGLYATIEDFVATYGLGGANIVSWDQVSAKTDWDWSLTTDPDGITVEQAHFLLELIAERYRGLHEAVRRYDPNHLIWGDKSILWTPIWQTAAPYIDLMLIQDYDIAANQLGYLDEYHSVTGLPVVMGDNAFTTQTECRCTPRGVEVATMEDVGLEYAKYMQELFEISYVVGWHHCGVMEDRDCTSCEAPAPPPGDSTLTCGLTCVQGGMMDPWENPYEEWIDDLLEANNRVYDVKSKPPVH